jgi:hypothetical protein
MSLKTLDIRRLWPELLALLLLLPGSVLAQGGGIGGGVGPVPEPATTALLGVGMAVYGAYRSRRR